MMASFTSPQHGAIFPNHAMGVPQMSTWGSITNGFPESNANSPNLPYHLLPSHSQLTSTSLTSAVDPTAVAAEGQVPSSQHQYHHHDFPTPRVQDTQGNGQWNVSDVYKNSGSSVFVPSQVQQYYHQAQYPSNMISTIAGDESFRKKYPQHETHETAYQYQGQIARELLHAQKAIHPNNRRSSRCRCPNCHDPSGTKKKLHPCNVPGCTKVYGKTSHLKCHLRWHMGDRPYVCDWEYCSKSFTRSDELLRHKRTHTGEKRFTCPLCAKKFMRSDHLHKHEKTHENRRQRLIMAMKEDPEDADVDMSEKEPMRQTATSGGHEDNLARTNGLQTPGNSDQLVQVLPESPIFDIDLPNLNFHTMQEIELSSIHLTFLPQTPIEYAADASVRLI